MGSGSLEQSPADGLSPWVLLAVIRQVSVEHLLGAWCCPGLSVLHLSKDVEHATDLQVPGERDSWQWGSQGQGPRQAQLSTQEGSVGGEGRGDSQSQRTMWALRAPAEAQGSQPPLPGLGNVPSGVLTTLVPKKVKRRVYLGRSFKVVACCPQRQKLGIQRLAPVPGSAPYPGTCGTVTSRDGGGGGTVATACLSHLVVGLGLGWSWPGSLAGGLPFLSFICTFPTGRCSICEMGKEKNWTTVPALVSFGPYHIGGVGTASGCSVLSPYPCLPMWKLRLGAVCPESRKFRGGKGHRVLPQVQSPHPKLLACPAPWKGLLLIHSVLLRPASLLC